MSDTEQAQTEQVQGQPEPTTPEAPPAQPAAQPVVGDGPWSADLATLFPDEAARTAADEFLRSKVQPYITQLEQKASGTQDAERLWSDLSSNPIDTYVAITHEMFGEEAAQTLLASLQAQTDEQQQQAPGEPAAQPDPRLENVLSYVEDQQAANLYDSELARIKQQDDALNEDLFHLCVSAAGGDFDAAYQIYSSQVSGLAPAPVVEETAETAPPVIGSGAEAQTTPPVVPKKLSIDEAIADFMDEQRAATEAPPVT